LGELDVGRVLFATGGHSQSPFLVLLVELLLMNIHSLARVHGPVVHARQPHQRAEQLPPGQSLMVVSHHDWILGQRKHLSCHMPGSSGCQMP